MCLSRALRNAWALSPNLDLRCMHPNRNASRFTARTKERDAIMKRKLAIVLALMALAGTAPLLTACYTTQGAGEDLQAAGHGLEHSAERHTGY